LLEKGYGTLGIVELLYRLLPIPAWKAGLARHMESCPACSQRLAGREDVRRVLVQADDLGGLDKIWPAVKRGSARTWKRSARPGSGYRAPLSRPRPAARSDRPLGGGLVRFGLGDRALVGTVRYLGRPDVSGGGDSLAETDGFVLHSARIENEPAKTYIIHPPDDGMIVVWLKKAYRREK